MDFGGIAKNVWTQFETAWGAPVPFIASVIFVGWLISLAVKHTFATRLANAESTISLQDRQLQDYKDKLDGATPDAAKARIDALEQRIEDGFKSLAPRTLTDEQHRIMVNVLEGAHGHHVTISQDAGYAEARPMSQKIAHAFLAARWITTTPMIMGLGNPPPSGIGLKVGDQTNLTQPQRVIVEAFREAGLELDIQDGFVDRNRPGMAPSVGEIIVTSPLV